MADPNVIIVVLWSPWTLERDMLQTGWLPTQLGSLSQQPADRQRQNYTSHPAAHNATSSQSNFPITESSIPSLSAEQYRQLMGLLSPATTICQLCW